MNGSPTTDVAPTAYEAFRAELRREPYAAECEQWAARHIGDPEEPRALVDAGWQTARGGGSERALELFHRAAGCGGEYARDAQVGVVEQLYALRREGEADTAQQALRAELEDHPGGRSDLRVFDDMAQMLSDAGKYELALGWCRAGLDRVVVAGDAAEVADHRRSLLITRGALRDELDLELDDEDLAVRAETDASIAALGDLVRGKWGDVFEGRPGGAEAFDGIVLRWVREDFTAIRTRWPGSTAHYGDDYETYAERIQREARVYDEAGATRVRLVSGNLADYETYAQRESRDPADRSTRRDYGEWYALAHPDQVRLWPPARNDMCWCDSGRKYKKCCGAPSKN